MVTIFMVTIFMVTILMVTILMWTIFMVTMLMVTILMATMVTIRMMVRQNGSPGGVTRLIGFTAFVGILLPWVPANPVENTHRGARTHDHKVKGLALCRLS